MPQPASDSYREGDNARVCPSESDLDCEHHGKQGSISDIMQDSLGSETGHELDSYSYRIETDGNEIDVWFRRCDLVPGST
ncbi:hypothetical protein DMJ13_23270 [halophilic archaeon]|nr:hypothetical protein DMJ13_23270 [halophilic archaeon]